MNEEKNHVTLFAVLFLHISCDEIIIPQLQQWIQRGDRVIESVTSLSTLLDSNNFD